MNEVRLMGKLTKDPELQTSKNGNHYMRFAISTKKEYVKKDDAGRNQLDFVNIIAYGGIAEYIAKHCRKGMYLVLKATVATVKTEYKGVTSWNNVITANMVEPVWGTGEGQQTENTFTDSDLASFADIDTSAIDPEQLPF
jgi:single-strand DNA-binding protein